MKRIPGIILFCLVACLALLWASTAVAQPSGPVLRHGNLLRIYVGSTSAPGSDWRVIVGTTWSTSPNADIGPPFDEASENPELWYRASDLRVVAANDPCQLEPEINLPCRDTGWVDVPVPDVRIEVPRGSGVWVPDADMRIIVHTVNAAQSGLCPVAACGAWLIVPRIKLSDVLDAPVTIKRRAVAR